MGDGLSVCRDQIVLLVAQVDVSGFKASESIFDHSDLLLRSAMMYDDLV
jgi:hypothetical protein